MILYNRYQLTKKQNNNEAMDAVNTKFDEELFLLDLELLYVILFLRFFIGNISFFFCYTQNCQNVKENAQKNAR